MNDTKRTFDLDYRQGWLRGQGDGRIFVVGLLALQAAIGISAAASQHERSGPGIPVHRALWIYFARFLYRGTSGTRSLADSPKYDRSRE
ncbi:MAG: hypothetical protein U5K69_26230 [Balneolaceae bacterium]|nr:hypothetical protein [Balneolaceae bacterium]